MFWSFERNPVLVCSSTSSFALLHFFYITYLRRPGGISQKWANRVLMEFFAQAQKEGQLNLPVTPFMDQHKVIIAKEQMNFISRTSEAKEIDWQTRPLYASLWKHRRNFSKYQLLRWSVEHKPQPMGEALKFIFLG